MPDFIRNEDIEVVAYKFPSTIGEQFIESYRDGRKMINRSSPEHVREFVWEVIEIGVETYYEYKNNCNKINYLTINGDRFSFIFNSDFYFGIVHADGFHFMCSQWEIVIGRR